VNKKKKIGTHGYCLGGAYVIKTAAEMPRRIGAGASLHGGFLVTDKPTSPHLLAPRIKARLYFAIASDDDKREPDAKNKLREGSNPVLSQSLLHLGIDLKGGFDLTTEACRQFNNNVSDAPGISYFSIAGQFRPKRILGLPQGPLGLHHDFVARKEGDNDGLVSVESATLAERPAWSALDVWEANHFRLVNWGANLAPTPHELADSSIVEKYRTLVNQVTAIK